MSGNNDVIVQAIKERGVQERKFYKLRVLYEIMYDLGLINMSRESFTSNWMGRKIRNGKIILPPNIPGGRWMLSGQDIIGIIREFAPGGSNKYNYQDQYE